MTVSQYHCNVLYHRYHKLPNMKRLFITEKKSVADAFAKALNLRNKKASGGYIESDDTIITWCVGHLITLSYPDKYDPSLKKWSLSTLPFIPSQYKYEVIPSSAKQYKVVKELLNRKDITDIYYSGDSAREGEYIQRLVRQMAGFNKGAREFRVWIDSQTDDEINKGIREAKPLSAYDNLSESGYMRAIEDYMTGINFSRVLSLKYSDTVCGACGSGHKAIAVGRVMSCVLGMVVERERLIRNSKEIPFFGVKGLYNDLTFEWRATEGSAYFESPLLYKENGFKEKRDAAELLNSLKPPSIIESIKKSTKTKAAPLLYNLAELQADCAKILKIKADATLAAAQTLYEKKVTTYPRTDARVLTTAVADEIRKNLSGLAKTPYYAQLAQGALDGDAIKKLKKTKYVNDDMVSDHYAIIPTGIIPSGLDPVTAKVYDLIVRRFLSIFYPPAKHTELSAVLLVSGERLYSSAQITSEPGFYVVTGKKDSEDAVKNFQGLSQLKKGMEITPEYVIHEGKTSPPKRYTSGSIILAMENAGNLIEDEDLRAQIKGSGIGTSATRAEILKKLEKNEHIAINKKTLVISPTKFGEVLYETIALTVPSLLNPKMTASWEKGLSMIANGEVGRTVYNQKLAVYVARAITGIKQQDKRQLLTQKIRELKPVYKDLKV